MTERFEFTPDTRIQDALEVDPRVPEIFKKFGWKCGDCVAAEKESLRIGALYHEKDLEELLRELNRHGFPKPPPPKDE
jgi:hybrid cluster-associated redox disulfide protein